MMAEGMSWLRSRLRPRVLSPPVQRLPLRPVLKLCPRLTPCVRTLLPQAVPQLRQP